MSEARLEALARAKINLFLHVGARRADGYHALMSWVAFAALGDRIEVETAEEGVSLVAEGPFANRLPADDDNLVLRAARAVAEAAARAGRAPPGARLKLFKALPLEAGMGGGSADAAATLHLLNEAWGVGIGGGELIELGATLGSDVPVCVYNRSALMAGRGEAVAPGPDLPDVPVVLVNPGVPVPTGDIFARLTARSGVTEPVLPDAIRDARQLAAVLAPFTNDLEAPALSLAPVIGETLAALGAQEGALLARMTGSGATCFALFADEMAAQSAAVALKRARPAWWVAATRLDC